MRNLKKFAVIMAAAGMMISFAGCETVVTDVTSMVSAQRSEELTGTIVDTSETIYVAQTSEAGNAETDVEEERQLASADEEVKETDEIKTTKEETKDSKEQTDKEDTEKESEDTQKTQESDTTDNDETAEDETDDSKEEDAEENSEEDKQTEEDSKESEETEGQDEESENQEGDGNEEEPLLVPDDFDAEFYATTYPDVVNVYGNSAEALYRHYLYYGQAEGRAKNASEYNLTHEAL